MFLPIAKDYYNFSLARSLNYLSTGTLNNLIIFISRKYDKRRHNVTIDKYFIVIQLWYKLPNKIVLKTLEKPLGCNVENNKRIKKESKLDKSEWQMQIAINESNKSALQFR